MSRTTSSEQAAMAEAEEAALSVRSQVLVRRHLTLGWSLLLGFLLLGIALDALLGFKIDWYVDLSNTTRRLMWTLAHAHGVLLGLVNIAYAGTLVMTAPSSSRRSTASVSLVSASVLLPGGFLLGGLGIHAGDPGVGILLTPIGAALLLAGVVLVLLDVRSALR